jgi:hypothetical protein
MGGALCPWNPHPSTNVAGFSGYPELPAYGRPLASPPIHRNGIVGGACGPRRRGKEGEPESPGVPLSAEAVAPYP